MSLEDAQRRSEQLIARVPKAERPGEPANPLTLEKSDDGATETYKNSEVQRETTTEAGERKVAEFKAAVEERFGGFFAGVRNRMEAIKNRAAQMLFGAVGGAMEAGTIVKKTGEGAMEVASAFNPLNSPQRNGKENVYSNVASDLKEEFAPVAEANVAAAKAFGRGTKAALEAGVGLGVMGAVAGAGMAVEGGRRALAAGQRGKEAAVGYSQDKVRELDGAIANAKIALAEAKGGAKTVAEDALRSLQAKKLAVEIRAGELKKDAGLRVDQMVDVVKGKYAETKESAQARLDQINSAIDNAKQLAKSATGVTKTAAENALHSLEARKLDAEITLRETLAAGVTSGEKAIALGKDRAYAAGRATKEGAKAVGRGAATVGLVSVGVGVMAAAGTYEIGRRGVAGTVAGAEAVGTKMKEVSVKGKERYDAAMEALNNKLETAVGFMAKMNIRMEIAKAVLRRSMNEVYKALTTDEMAEQEPEVYTGTIEAIDDLNSVDEAAARERVGSVA